MHPAVIAGNIHFHVAHLEKKKWAAVSSGPPK
jgi:hypothetical protein